MLTHSAIAIFAAVIGSVVTLFSVGAFSQSVVATSNAEPVQVVSTILVEPDTVRPDSDLADDLQQLRSALNDGDEERLQMAETLIQLSRDLADVQAQISTLERANSERLSLAPLGQTDLSTGISQTQAPVARGPNRRNQQQTGQERVDSLIAAGIDSQTAQNIQTRRDQQQLARLELFDQAAREGWSDSDQLQERLTELNAGRVDLREELGDEAYDRFLYESGDANRVNIVSVITGSAAALAGLETGDSIVSYDNERIFRVSELQQATRAGSRGENVQILFDRGGQFSSADLPRGPLGVTLGTTSVAP